MLCSGLKKDGTFAEYAIVPSRDMIRLPEGVLDQLIAPIPSRRVTAYKAIKVSEAAPGQRIATPKGGGGAMGYRVTAIDVGETKKGHCLQLGAEAYFDAKKDRRSCGASLDRRWGSNGSGEGELQQCLPVYLGTVEMVSLDDLSDTAKNLGKVGSQS
ncbi:uncharacterized protein Z518_03462 [Rhinocladiella mackenziei CBS 650.93]|uniref:Rhinocladiella mackenziei CBS 650.93 unplaced genomic scaffold supercont1.2, whole genome shotgun sequence n=1 Tax=Rhinocladiella mackenziei CBS 650.93 TaxID=1442369 RepID=A0A0D2JHH2_9EURO|nr:uncharacterized protein Z518_03462 [Rhinocladiella mackenziei CBS 650.93]KIX08805.1 hypothetical protein Z518_03462 [Rhinocladiella mackenziei CBS 650.93]